MVLGKNNRIDTEQICVCTRQSQEVEQTVEVRVSIVASVEMLLSIVDAAARLILVDNNWLMRIGGIVADSWESLKAADGSPVNAIETGVLRFGTWGSDLLSQWA